MPHLLELARIHSSIKITLKTLAAFVTWSNHQVIMCTNPSLRHVTCRQCKNTPNTSESTFQSHTAFSILDVPCELEHKSYLNSVYTLFKLVVQFQKKYLKQICIWTARPWCSLSKKKPRLNHIPQVSSIRTTARSKWKSLCRFCKEKLCLKEFLKFSKQHMWIGEIMLISLLKIQVNILKDPHHRLLKQEEKGANSSQELKNKKKYKKKRKRINLKKNKSVFTAKLPDKSQCSVLEPM